MARTNPWKKRASGAPVVKTFGPYNFTFRRLNGAEILGAAAQGIALAEEWEGKTFPVEPEYGPVTVDEPLCRVAALVEAAQLDRSGVPLCEEECYRFSDLVGIANDEEDPGPWLELVTWTNSIGEAAAGNPEAAPDLSSSSAPPSTTTNPTPS